MSAHRNTVLMYQNKALDFLHLFLQHFKLFAPPFTSIIGGSRASASSLLTRVRPVLGTEVCLPPTSEADTPTLASSALLLLGLRSPCCSPPPRRRRSLSGEKLVVELGFPSSASFHPEAFEVDGASQEEVTGSLTDP